MRVKKLSANRRHKPGDEESAGPDADQRRWGSPTKAAGSATGADSGASSPTDPYSVHPVELKSGDLSPHTTSEVSPTRFHLDAFGGGMPKNMAPQVLLSQDNAAGRGGAVAKSRLHPADWHDSVDNAVREAVHAKMVEILRALKPNAPEKVLERVPGLAYRMEESLFRLAQSVDEYRDESTLPYRLAQIQEASTKRLLQQQSSDVAMSGNPHGAARELNPAARRSLSEEQARVVFQCLQSWRQKLVSIYGVAPWEILPNQALAKVALYLPSSEQELGMCELHDEQIARFGSSLLQELQQICSAWSGSSVKPDQSASKLFGSKGEGSKRPAADSASSTSKRRKPAASTGDSSFMRNTNGAARLAPAPPASYGSTASSGTSSMLASSQLLFRPPGIDTLPTLLPSASVASATAGKKAFGPTSGRLSPPGQVIQPPLFARLDSGRQENNHMHLLAQGAGQVSKQQQVQQHESEAPSAEAYEKEIQTLRWMLQQSQHEKSQLEAEVQHLRQQLQSQ